ncbi:MAG: polysaccharide pyruvyl transferase family protein [Cypionkella sp.]|uniref:polysaccharide pyruvyl transferase family protein n=1 Tax=Cypionkella sp. TaxID=2811411 RepID=UPI00271963C5|nr:polysaccharide pyruvyl transferase family protein [Cypionkella sp.]MDO8328520.1 polysaccharide pyruvyl transferase family protein [Cypionkella sp.]
MRLFLANDTATGRHAGCNAVMRSLNAALAAVPGLQVIGRHTVGSESLDEAAFLEADALLINGEGTLHHSTARAMLLLAMLDEAKRMGKRVLLVNALFQQYEGPEDILANLALLTVREPRSAAFARRFGGRPLVLLDSAADPAFLGLGTPRPLRHGTVIGGAHANGLLKSPFAGIAGDTLAMTDARFEDIVATLRQAELYLTAQHHGVYAAALAGCPFIATPSNSHKIESFINWTGLPIPICLRQDEIESAMAFARRNPSIYVELQDFLRSQSVLTAAMIAEALR